jgi:hypothetical protein
MTHAVPLRTVAALFGECCGSVEPRFEAEACWMAGRLAGVGVGGNTFGGASGLMMSAGSLPALRPSRRPGPNRPFECGQGKDCSRIPSGGCVRDPDRVI